jgi:Putative peptidoglycan binding domain
MQYGDTTAAKHELGDLFNDIMGAVVPGWGERPQALKNLQLKVDPAKALAAVQKIAPGAGGQAVQAANAAGLNVYANTPAGKVLITPEMAQGAYKNYPMYTETMDMVGSVLDSPYTLPIVVGGIGLGLYLMMKRWWNTIMSDSPAENSRGGKSCAPFVNRSLIASTGWINAPCVRNGDRMPMHLGEAQITVGSQGGDVKRLQEILSGGGYNVGVIDGIFGPQTLAAVKAFQLSKGLLADGVVGPQTWAALFAPVAPAPAPAPVQPQTSVFEPKVLVIMGVALAGLMVLSARK